METKREFFYITTRDGQIFEIENQGTRLQDCLELWQKGGLIILPNLGININGVDISKILNEDQYQNFIDSAQPKQFIKNGAWFDLKERSKPIRYEKWRELELEEKRKLLLENPENKKASQEEIDGWLKKYRPDIVNDKIKLVEKMKVINETKPKIWV